MSAMMQNAANDVFVRVDKNVTCLSLLSIKPSLFLQKYGFCFVVLFIGLTEARRVN
jgi:hypothetical protein